MWSSLHQYRHTTTRGQQQDSSNIKGNTYQKQDKRGTTNSFNCSLIILEIQTFFHRGNQTLMRQLQTPSCHETANTTFSLQSSSTLATTLSKLLTCFNCSFSYFFKLVFANHYSLTLKQGKGWVINSARTALIYSTTSDQTAE